MSEEKIKTPLVKAAHIENVPAYSIGDLYTHHAEAARLAHDHTANLFTHGQPAIDVNLITQDALKITDGTINVFKTHDIISISSGLTTLGGLASRIGAQSEDIKALWRDTDVIVVDAAGNISPDDYDWHKRENKTVYNFLSTNLSVGEVGKNSQGDYFVKAHNKLQGISVLAENPYDNGLTVQYVSPPTSLKGHEEVIDGWLQDKELASYLNEEYPSFKTLPADEQRELYLEAIEYIHSDPDRIAARAAQVQQFIEQPELLHKQVMPIITEALSADENGVIGTGLTGTSFSAPAMAGYLTAAKAEERARKAEGKPALTSQELVALVYLSAKPVTLKAGQAEPIEYQQNIRGLHTSNEAGFGVFEPEQFKQNLSRAHALLEQNPALATNEHMLISNKNRYNEKIGGYEVTVSDTLGRAQGNIALKTLIHFDINQDSLGFRAFPITLISPSGTKIDTFVNADPFSPNAWVETDKFLGEETAGEWTVILPDDITLELTNPSIEVLTTPKGSLIDQMIEEKGQQTKLQALANDTLRINTQLANTLQNIEQADTPEAIKQLQERYNAGRDYIEAEAKLEMEQWEQAKNDKRSWSSLEQILESRKDIKQAGALLQEAADAAQKAGYTIDPSSTTNLDKNISTLQR